MEEIQVTDMHTGGEILRIVDNGLLNIQGKTVIEKRRYIRDNLDHLRQRLMYEPRGHQEQYGAILVDADRPECDIGVIFMHTGGYSTMCGHACIALGRYIVDNNLHKNKEVFDEKYLKVTLQCPCGVVELKVEFDNGKTGDLIKNADTDLRVTTESHGTISVDIGYGGTFYVLVDISQPGSTLQMENCDELKKLTMELTSKLENEINLEHPDSEDLCFLYGAIFTDGKDMYCSEPTENLCIFGKRQQIDRSPTGSGVTARLAVQYAKKQISLGAERTFQNALTKSDFTGKVVEKTSCGKFSAVRIKVTGHAYYCGKMTLLAEQDDPFKDGFLLL